MGIASSTPRNTERYQPYLQAGVHAADWCAYLIQHDVTIDRLWTLLRQVNPSMLHTILPLREDDKLRFVKVDSAKTVWPLFEWIVSTCIEAAEKGRYRIDPSYLILSGRELLRYFLSAADPTATHSLPWHESCWATLLFACEWATHSLPWYESCWATLLFACALAEERVSVCTTQPVLTELLRTALAPCTLPFAPHVRPDTLSAALVHIAPTAFPVTPETLRGWLEQAPSASMADAIVRVFECKEPLSPQQGVELEGLLLQRMAPHARVSMNRIRSWSGLEPLPLPDSPTEEDRKLQWCRRCEETQSGVHYSAPSDLIVANSSPSGSKTVDESTAPPTLLHEPSEFTTPSTASSRQQESSPSASTPLTSTRKRKTPIILRTAASTRSLRQKHK